MLGLFFLFDFIEFNFWGYFYGIEEGLVKLFC